jgi:hypothetical protein
MHCGLEECEEATESRFLIGFNTEIQDMLLHETYNSLTCLVIRCRLIFEKGSLACCNVLRGMFQTYVQTDLRKHYFRTLTLMQNEGWFVAQKGRRG